MKKLFIASSLIFISVRLFIPFVEKKPKEVEYIAYTQKDSNYDLFNIIFLVFFAILIILIRQYDRKRIQNN